MGACARCDNESCLHGFDIDMVAAADAFHNIPPGELGVPLKHSPDEAAKISMALARSCKAA